MRRAPRGKPAAFGDRFRLVRQRAAGYQLRMPTRMLLLFAGILAFAAPANAQLTTVDVERVIAQGVSRAIRISPNSVIAVTDREGLVLGVWTVRGGEPTPDEIANAVSRAGTAALLSSNANAFQEQGSPSPRPLSGGGTCENFP